MLSDERIRELYKTAELDADWVERSQRFIDRIAAMPDEELLRRERQQMLWPARDVTTLCRHEHVIVGFASEDRRLVEAVVKLRSTKWPEDIFETDRGDSGCVQRDDGSRSSAFRKKTAVRTGRAPFRCNLADRDALDGRATPCVGAALAAVFSVGGGNIGAMTTSSEAMS